LILKSTTKKTTKLNVFLGSLVVFSSLITTNLNAAAIGGLESIVKSEPDKKPEPETVITPVMQLGLGTNISQVSISDDVGETDKLTSVQALSIYLAHQLNQDLRYLSEVNISKYGFEADGSYLGQEINQQGLRFSIQKNTRIYSDISVWLGGGLELSNSSYRKRHTVDSQGFLLKEYENEVKPGLGILLNAMQKWRINDNMDIAAKIEYSLPVVQSASRLSIGFVLFFNLNTKLNNTSLENVE